MENLSTTSLISIEGLDSSFKETNVKLLKNKLEEDGYSVVSFDFPQYKRDSSYFVRSFLNNPSYRDNPETFEDCCKYCIYYALDRYDTYINEIKDYMGKVDVILFDRYITSNLHNAARMMPDINKALNVLEWFYRFEYETLKLPKEDISIFLNMPYEKSKIIRHAKVNKDLNEADELFCKHSYEIFDMIYNLQNEENKKYSKEIQYITRIGPIYKININLDVDNIDFVKTLTDEEERNKSKEIIFDKICDESYIFIQTAIKMRKSLYGKKD